VPSGYIINGAYDENGNYNATDDCQQTFVSGETKIIAFQLQDIGSPPPHVKAKLKLKGPKGRAHNLNLDIPGINIAQEKAGDKARGKPFMTEGAATILLLAVLAALAAFFVLRKKQ